MFLQEPPDSDDVRALYEKGRAADGYVMNLAHVWAWRPDCYADFVALRSALRAGSRLSDAEVALLNAATAAHSGDAYCSLAWGTRLAAERGDAVAAQVVEQRDPDALNARERALLAWVRHVVAEPSATSAADVTALREAGFDDREIFEATLFIAFRRAFGTVNAALGALPDEELAARAPDAVRDAVTFGRQPATAAP